MKSKLNQVDLGALVRRRIRMSGVSLIEVLVTVVVLSIGLLGLAGMQATGSKFNHSAYLRSQAVNLAYDMADRMRANIGDDYSTPAGTAFDAGGGAECGELLDPFTVDADINQWKNCIEEALPIGRGAVVLHQPAAGNFVDSCGGAHLPAGRAAWLIEVSWDSSRIAAELDPNAAENRECVVVKTEVAPL